MNTKCPITKKYLDCLKCKVDWGNDRCPYMDFDDLVQRTLKLLRRMVENESKNTTKD